MLVELKRRGVKLKRDVILLSESDEEAGSTGINWLVHNAYPKIDAAFALNEGGAALDVRSGTRIFQIQTSEKIPTRVVLTARGTAGHASLPRPDNPVVHLARAITRAGGSAAAGAAQHHYAPLLHRYLEASRLCLARVRCSGNWNMNPRP